MPARRASPEVAQRVLERDLENYGTGLLELDGWRSLKTDPVSRREWGKGFGEPGMADRLYIRYKHTVPDTSVEYAGWEPEDAEVLWIEWKRIRPGHKAATKAEHHQQTWIAAERARGALVWLAGVDFVATPEAFYTHYRGSGLMRRAISPPGAR